MLLLIVKKGKTAAVVFGPTGLQLGTLMDLAHRKLTLIQSLILIGRI